MDIAVRTWCAPASIDSRYGSQALACGLRPQELSGGGHSVVELLVGVHERGHPKNASNAKLNSGNVKNNDKTNDNYVRARAGS